MTSQITMKKIKPRKRFSLRSISSSNMKIEKLKKMMTKQSATLEDLQACSLVSRPQTLISISLINRQKPPQRRQLYSKPQMTRKEDMHRDIEQQIDVIQSLRGDWISKIVAWTVLTLVQFYYRVYPVTVFQSRLILSSQSPLTVCYLTRISSFEGIELEIAKSKQCLSRVCYVGTLVSFSSFRACKAEKFFV